MTPDNYVKTMKRLITMDEQRLFETFLAEKAKYDAAPIPDVDGLGINPKLQSCLDTMDAVADVLAGKYGFTVHLN